MSIDYYQHLRLQQEAPVEHPRGRGMSFSVSDSSVSDGVLLFELYSLHSLASFITHYSKSEIFLEIGNFDGDDDDAHRSLVLDRVAELTCSHMTQRIVFSFEHF